MTTEEKLKNIKDFIEDQLWYMTDIAQEMHLPIYQPREVKMGKYTPEELTARLTLLQDIKEVMEGRL